MDLAARAESLRKLGFFDGLKKDLANARICEEARRSHTAAIEAGAPATALLLAAGVVLVIPEDAAPAPEHYAAVLQRIAAFTRGALAVSEVQARLLDDRRIRAGEDDEEGRILSLSFKINGRKTETEITHYPDLIDLSFLAEFEHALVRMKHPRRLCPLIELPIDAHFLFVEPQKMDQAIARGLINPDGLEEAE